MSFLGSKNEARAIISDIEVSENTHTSSGTSPILRGASSPGGAASSRASVPAGETQQVGRLRKGIKTPRTRTDSLTRKYASTGTN